MNYELSSAKNLHFYMGQAGWVGRSNFAMESLQKPQARSFLCTIDRFIEFVHSLYIHLEAIGCDWLYRRLKVCSGDSTSMREQWDVGCLSYILVSVFLFVCHEQNWVTAQTNTCRHGVQWYEGAATHARGHIMPKTWTWDWELIADSTTLSVETHAFWAGHKAAAVS